MLKGIDFLIDFRIDFYAVLAPTWTPLGPQVGAILALKIAEEPPEKLPRTHLGARTRPDPRNGFKMEVLTPQKEASDPPFLSYFGAQICRVVRIFNGFLMD